MQASKVVLDWVFLCGCRETCVCVLRFDWGSWLVQLTLVVREIVENAVCVF